MYNPGVRWNHEKPDECRQLAEQLVGPSPLGYLYRMEWDHTTYSIKLCAIKILKKTPKGWCIRGNKPLKSRHGYASIWVAENGYQRFAAPDVGKALVSYQARKAKYCAILQAKLEMAERSREAADPDKDKRNQELDFLID